LHFRACRLILAGMHELDEVWSQMLAEAIENARVSGRHDVADYLALKASNDLIRQTSVKWLFDVMIEIVSEANRTYSNVAIEREDPHNFTHHGANMVGSLLRVRQGVRCLTLEAGWTRTPKDGFMRGGALAFARITHFGFPKANAELILARRDDVPVWNLAGEKNSSGDFGSDGLREHFQVFTGE
jgi:hypothetical protein